MFKIYRIIHIIWTAIFAFYIAIPILEGGIEKAVYANAICTALWIFGVIFLFIKKLRKTGFILTILPLVYAIFIYIF